VEHRKRILFIHHGAGLGGAALSLAYLIRGLDKNRFEPLVLCIQRDAPTELFRREGAQTIYAGPLMDAPHTTMCWLRWYQLVELARIIWDQVRVLLWIAPHVFEKHAPDLVHLNTSSLWAWAMAARKRGIPVVCHIREPLARGYFGIRRKITRERLDRYTNACIAICRFDANQLAPSTRNHVVFNFVDFSQFNRQPDPIPVKRRLGMAKDEAMILFLGGLSKEKGTLELLRSAAGFLKPRRVLFIAGRMGGDLGGIRKAVLSVFRALRVAAYRVLVERELQRLRLTHPNQVRLIGLVSNVPELMAACDLLVFPATVPHFARPVIEAAAMGKPSIASGIGGLPELVSHGETGILINPKDPVSLSEAIETVLNDDTQRMKFGDAAYDKARREFDASINIEKIVAVYDTLPAAPAPDLRN